MKVINVTLKVKPELTDEYRHFISLLVEGSRAEAGNLSYDHFQSLTDPNKYEIIEHWQDAAAVELHNQTAHFQKFLAGIDDFLAEPLEIVRMDYAE
ncbi:putative quinol monooxygenase [Lacticaseibacillus zeae]|uniref:Quinol monooxygenase n=1 Tax=Lacticaseibacillus zeae subsp. silagei TaxID=3068307 RepID=A0ABD7ZCZ9_LACZE|nr:MULTISPECIES: putative quinol monooxygenase [Lacticaseibacillus]MDE3314893.1 antibiotic biosynthesis monooxygenase [Lacticaseibacillus zeae]OFR94991.1 antibiotic biosynthesis monooxygenase [Lactobacillus sp. HMSC068F07]WLV84677.1 putative quinol monooxygenase [Lacticaseibacillus sp. NCIMB 15475]WLV87379.1 putative quinol monooxygenase [Lacticaseibacillus sp. NCIMB 15474]